MSNPNAADAHSTTAPPGMVARRQSTFHDDETAAGLPRDPAVHRNLCRRLAGVALLYAGTYATVHVVMLVLTSSDRFGSPDVPSHTLYHTLVAISVVVAVVIAWLAASGRVSARAFPWVAASFQVVGALGIVGGYVDWPTWTNHALAHLSRILGPDPATIAVAFDGATIDVIGFGGIAWVWVWMLIVPLVIPLPTRVVTVGALLTASTVPIMLLVGMASDSVGPELQRSAIGFIGRVTVPGFVCAIMAIAGSRVVYQLTRELSRAREMGSYRLVEKIGEGGMGEVWRAEHRMLARPAAIKLIRTDALGSSANLHTTLRRFEKEAQVIASLQSPHTVSLYDFGVTDEGRFYYVMELLEGIDLRSLVERFGPQSAGRTRHLLIQACHSLADAHRAGVLHRDVKPGNLFACRRGADFDFVKMLDFGLVKEIGATTREVQLTAEGITTGTPAFMAPEMVTGAPVDGRTDLYALGCVGFWLLTGRLVFEGETAMAIIAKHVSDPPRPPSSCTELDVPEELDRILLDCLAKDPHKRVPDASTLARRLETEVDAGDWTPARTEQWWQTHFPIPR